MLNIALLNGDITQAEVDAIVNAANPKMLGGGGVDGAIHRAAGPALLRACFDVEENNGKRCGWGDAKITSAGELNAKYVIHAVGPIYHQFCDPKAVLQSAYRQALNLALENNCESVALPAISCGAYGYPQPEAAQVALSVCSEQKYKGMQLTFYLFGEDMLETWQSELDKIKE
ncbi:macro domain-containing protein [Vibrio agarivorans]|uniref:macro domain-containing protein n=1 Tax=Vibrio agarivorans TaxID=153622 RepID=UPI002230250C|nr:macro domain-containing protein [Vibrio agarivorans]MDN3660423.1 macro domain-containing protein [Vibrio agarivorans]